MGFELELMSSTKSLILGLFSFSIGGVFLILTLFLVEHGVLEGDGLVWGGDINPLTLIFAFIAFLFLGFGLFKIIESDLSLFEIESA